MRACVPASPAQAAGVTAMSRAFWRGDVKREPLQRVYAITFPEPKLLKEYQHRMEEVGGGGALEGGERACVCVWGGGSCG